jgi:hypothetical protein
MGAVSNSDKTDPNEQDDFDLAQFSPEVLEFILGVVRTRKSRQDRTIIPESAEVVAPS